MSVAEWLDIFQTVGVPSTVAGISFWYIYRKDQWARQERSEYMKVDSSHDDRMFELAEKGNEAMTQMSVQLAEHTKSIDNLIIEIRRGEK